MSGGIVEFGGKPRAIGAQRMKLHGDRVTAGFGFAFPRHRSLQRFQRLREPAGSGVDGARVSHVTQHSLSQKLLRHKALRRLA